MNRFGFTKPLLTLAKVSAKALSVVLFRLLWASTAPSRPAWMPASSLWISGPHTPFEFARLGEWVVCNKSSDKSAQCWLTNDKGAVLAEGCFLPVMDSALHRIQIQQGELPDFSFYLRSHNKTIRIIRLQNGNILAPMQNRADFNAIREHFAAH